MRGYVTPGTRAALRRLGSDNPRGDDDHRHPGQSLEGVAPVLGLYYRALAGRNAALLSFGNQDDPAQYPDTHTTIRLPARINRFAQNAGNFAWYKVALTHRAAHYEGGTFGFRFDACAPHFARLRPPRDAVEHYAHETDLEAFFRLFAQREFAIEVFTLCEDLRLDAWAKRRYLGLARAFDRVQQAALADRPAMTTLRPRDALAEVAVRCTLNDDSAPALPALLHEPVRQLRAALLPLRSEVATVEDSAEAALRAYCILLRLPNLEADYGKATVVDLHSPPQPFPWPTTWPEPERTHLEGDDVLATTIVPVGYRDRLGSRYTLYRGAGPLDQQAIYRFTEATHPGNAVPSATATDTDADRPQPPPEPMEHDHHDHFGEDPEHHQAGELHAHEVSSYVYPEWDHVQGAYRRNWCLVRETRLDPGPSTRYFDETLQAYGALVPEIRRHIERLSREGLRKVHRLPHGEELDLDAAIEALVDRRAGHTPSEHVYVSRQRLARDVAAAFLVDVSASTAEHVDAPAGADVRGSDAAGSSSLPTVLNLHGRNYRTILDLEKETIALLMTALERIGDTYGIYGFSGTGREDVRFMVVKDLEERLSDRIAARLSSMRPVHTTRMGPAIRHAVRKLRAHEARTRLLVLISDGRPFDLDYGQEYGEEAEIEYAIRDTRAALEEARHAGIAPFVLTVDPEGNDYLRDMCDGLDYEVLRDVRQLPARLLMLYRGLTASA
ncbi:MAG: VWA domain-containing protein [Casimicrobiaceae bacterium]